MYAKLSLCTLLLHLLTPTPLGSSDDVNIKTDDQLLHSYVHSHSLHHDHHGTTTDPAIAIFFFFEDLKVGHTMPVFFPKRKLSDSFSHLLKKEEADSIPFSSTQLPQILHLFSFSQDSPQATAMAATLDECDRQPIQGEIKFCATSNESMSQFLQTIFGSNTAIKSVATAHVKRSEDDNGSRLVQKYRIMGIKRVPSPKMVSCHTMPYAYTVFYCHYHDSDNRAYRVSLVGENGDEVDAIAVCHMDTSQWGRNHVAFGVLGVEPGSTPVCHFFPADNFVWVPIMSSAEA